MRGSISNDGLSEALSQTERQATGSGVYKQVRKGGRSVRRDCCCRYTDNVLFPVREDWCCSNLLAVAVMCLTNSNNNGDLERTGHVLFFFFFESSRP